MSDYERKKQEADEAQSILHEEYMDLDKQNEKMRADGMPIPSVSVDATAGASVTNFKEFQEAALLEVKDMTPKQMQMHIRKYKFEIWATTTKMMKIMSHLNQVADKLSKEARADLKLSDIQYNPKELATPQRLSTTKRGVTLTKEERTARDLQKLMPGMSISDILELQRKAVSAAFQRGLQSGAGTPAAVDVCSECGEEYPATEKHKCPKKPTLRLVENTPTAPATEPQSKLSEKDSARLQEVESLMTRLAKIRAAKENKQ